MNTQLVITVGAIGVFFGLLMLLNYKSHHDGNHE